MSPDELREQSRVFNEGTKKLKNRTKWSHRKITAVTVIIVLLIIAVIVLAIVLPLTITSN
jgi:competence protein ComGC